MMNQYIVKDLGLGIMDKHWTHWIFVEQANGPLGKHQINLKVITDKPCIIYGL